MDDLNSSPAFDERHLEFIQRVLSDRPMNPISAIEQEFIHYGPVYKKINEELEYKLVANLRRWKMFLSVQETLRFLLISVKRKKLPTAVYILNTTVEDGRTANFSSLVTILDESETMPTSWAIPLNTEDADDRHKAPKLPSGLNLEAMKNFK